MLEKKLVVEKSIEEWEGREGLELPLRKKRAELETIVMQIDQNAQEVPDLLAKTQELGPRRDLVCAEFIAMKQRLIDHHLPQLSGLVQRMQRTFQERRNSTATNNSHCA